MSVSEDDVVSLSFPDVGKKIDRWISYSCNSHFTTPTDGFEFVVAANDVPDDVLALIKSGSKVSIDVNGFTQANGFIDRINRYSSRSGGTLIRVEGCDALAQVVRAGIDPRTQFTNGQTLNDVLATVFGPFGYTTNNLLVDNDTNRGIRSGAVRGDKVSSKGKPLKSFLIHQGKPYPGERAFAFASRIAQRFGLWIWLSSENNNLICGRPTFDQPPRYRLIATKDGSATYGNIESGMARDDATDQPSCIVASGFSFGGESDRSRLKVIAVNEIVAIQSDGTAIPSVAAIITANPDASVLPIRSNLFASSVTRPHPSAQPIYLHDQESQTLEELQNYARRELALKQKSSLHVTYTVEGHSNQGAIWCVDCMVDVQDDFIDVHEPLWILSRTFEKSRDGGTKTHLELIRPYTMVFGA